MLAMCLSIVYKNRKVPENIVMANAAALHTSDGVMVITDLLGNQVAVEGELMEANFVKGFVVLQEKTESAL